MAEEFNWGDLVPTAARPAIYAYKYRHLIQGQWVKLQAKLGLGSPSVLVTGRAGVGKSVLAAHYHGEANSHDWNLPSTSPDIEVKPISIGDWTKLVYVVPGQDSKERSIALDLAFNRVSDLEGVIHVVDWGFTAVRDETIKREMINNGIDTTEKFRERNLRLEIDDFRLMIDRIITSKTNNRGPKWLVIAVNKVDLYLDKIEEAKSHYHPSINSEFTKEIHKLFSSVGNNNIKVGCIPVCSMPEPFEWNGMSTKSKIDRIMEYKGLLRRFIDEVAVVQKSTEK